MNAEEALKFIEDLLFQQGQRLTDLQRLVFLGTWNGKSYELIHSECENRCSLDHLKRNVGYQLWRLLSEVLEEKVSKNMLQGCVHRAKQKWHDFSENGSLNKGQASHDQTNNGQANNSHQEQSAISQVSSPMPDQPSPNETLAPPLEFDDWMLPILAMPQADWRDAPLDKPFYGCSALLEQLDHAIRVDLCRLLSLYGISGIGKTALALQLARQVMDQFEFVIWRSLKQAPTPAALLTDLLHYIRPHQETTVDLSQLMQHITQRRCLIILDGFEAVLRGKVHDGSYREGYETYGELLRQVGLMSHESCLIVTGWENPKEMLEIEVNPRYVRFEDVRGLGAGETKELFKARNCSGTDLHWRELIRRYWGHPLVLSSVAIDVQEFCGGDTAQFLEQFHRTSIPERLRHRLDQQFERLSQPEQSVVRYLQQQGDPISIPALQQAFREQISELELLKVLRSLIRRALIERNTAGYSLQNLAMEYVQVFGIV